MGPAEFCRCLAAVGISRSKLPSTDLSTGTVWAFNSPETILHIAKQSRTFGLI
jgi:hypothetical protein